MVKRLVLVLTFVILLGSVFTGIAVADGSIADVDSDVVYFIGEENLSVMHLVGFKAAERAMGELGFQKGDPDVLALTDAGYIAEIGVYTTEKALDGVTQTSGNSRGKGNLVNVHKPYNSSLWFAFFDKESNDCVYLEAKSDVLETYLDNEQVDREAALGEFIGLSDEDIFVRIAKENIDADNLLSDPEAWQDKMVDNVFGGNEFTLITICNLWAMGLPNDFLKVAELHDHICPGLTSGYLIAEYIKTNLTSSNPRNEYTIIAIPPWCKDDALIQIFETNVGHKRLYVKHLTADQQAQLPPEAKNVANIVIKMAKGAQSGDGMVVAFDWDTAFEETGTSRADLKAFDTYKWWWMRLKMDIWMMDYLDKPEELVSTIKTFTVNSEELENLKAAGVNPLVELGIMPESESSQGSPAWMYAILGILAVLTIGSVAYAATLRRRQRN